MGEKSLRQITVPPGLNLEERLQNAPVEYSLDKITERRYPSSPFVGGVWDVDFISEVSHGDALAKNKLFYQDAGWKNARIEHLLSFVSEYPDQFADSRLISLESLCQLTPIFNEKKIRKLEPLEEGYRFAEDKVAPQHLVVRLVREIQSEILTGILTVPDLHMLARLFRKNYGREAILPVLSSSSLEGEWQFRLFLHREVYPEEVLQSSADVQQFIASQGWQTASWEHLVIFGDLFPQEQFKSPIVALASRVQLNKRVSSLHKKNPFPTFEEYHWAVLLDHPENRYLAVRRLS